MNKKTRPNFSAAFKAKVAIEALKEQSTLSDLAAKYELHPNQITEWKKALLSGSEDVFRAERNGIIHLMKIRKGMRGLCVRA